MPRTTKHVERDYPVNKGYACRCEQCESERGSEVQLYRLDKWCPGCGHGYIHTGDGGVCAKCGHSGGWLDSKPTLPFMPKAEPVDRVLVESRAVVARVLEVYNPEYVQHVCETDYFSLLATVKRLERALGEIDAIKVQEAR